MIGERLLAARGVIARFLVTGGAMSALDLGLYSCGALLLHWHPILAHIVGTLITICVSFLLNRAFVFRSQGSGVGAFVPFVVVTLVTALVIQTLIITGVVHACGALFPDAPEGAVEVGAKVIAVGCAAVCNFVSYRVIFARFGSAGA
ncbi:hypothetical protein DEO23_06170 [Brachybacterium endophyticum]|uniref:GtrA/DPMS transmembrane domain-containing protein n=1 Tax=Brachybacterium endophyticum TaxID=2182385 RepID=A0A2U2RL29_9MICO|nr:GtrA family protein [Brachybacterium endophyticum]PWH06541.1 hypothetical protein DEO23_06170 [Brachybacterium endophyticum]